MPLTARRAIPALVAVTVLSMGCGDEVAEFRDRELRPLEDQAGEQRARLSATLQIVEVGDRRDARLLETQLATLDQTFVELARLDPPSDFEETYERFVSANQAFADRMREFASALRRGKRREMTAATNRAKGALGAAQRAIQPLHE